MSAFIGFLLILFVCILATNYLAWGLKIAGCWMIAIAFYSDGNQRIRKKRIPVLLLLTVLNFIGIWVQNPFCFTVCLISDSAYSIYLWKKEKEWKWVLTWLIGVAAWFFSGSSFSVSWVCSFLTFGLPWLWQKDYPSTKRKQTT